MAENLRAPFPYFGSKRLIADQVWKALGNVASYCEPFAGSLAVLLARPGGAGRIETVNDLDGFVANFWRAVKWHRDELHSLSDRLDYPVVEIDLHARHRWLVARGDGLARALDADPDYYDLEAAAWWAWGLSAWIGSGWCSGRSSTKVPEIGHTGQGVHGVAVQLPSISDTGAGVHSVSNRDPHLGHAGKGVHGRRVGIHDVIDRLSERMRRVRVLCGDFRRCITTAALCDRHVDGGVGVFLDPPYAAKADGKARTMGLYGRGCDVAEAADLATEWARDAAAKHPRWRIVISGYEGERELEGWQVVSWDTSTKMWNSGGYGRKAGNQAQENTSRERLWLSPACLDPKTVARQVDMFGSV